MADHNCHYGSICSLFRQAISAVSVSVSPQVFKSMIMGMVKQKAPGAYPGALWKKSAEKKNYMRSETAPESRLMIRRLILSRTALSAILPPPELLI